MFQFTHPVRGATTAHRSYLTITQVSIHAPREGCDDDSESAVYTDKVSIHAPREGCD